MNDELDDLQGLDEWDEEREIERENERRAECSCGAYVWSSKQMRFVQVADCCC